MECTAQAFEEMQEQNIRLLMQLKVVGVGRVGGGGVEVGEGGVEEDGGREGGVEEDGNGGWEEAGNLCQLM